MRFRIILIALLAGLLMWSMDINKQTNELLDEAQEVISKQSKTIAEQQYQISDLSNKLEQSLTEQKVLKAQNIELLARLINAEAGSDWCEFEMKRLVGVVALNRMKNDGFPNTLEEVIYDDGQYACVTDGNINKEPSYECYRIAEDLLEHGYSDPESVIYQAEFPQGSEIYKVIQNMYFCKGEE